MSKPLCKCDLLTHKPQTGLCVYEVDDPNQRSDAPDESSRLLKRVAELEGVIREVPHLTFAFIVEYSY